MITAKPLHDHSKYVHVARDERDACLSSHNHGTGFTPEMLADMDASGLADALIARPYPRRPADPADYVHMWLTEGVLPGATDGVPAAVWPRLVEAASFAATRREGAALMGPVVGSFRGGAERFFHQGTNGRWRGLFRPEDLALYDAKVRATLEPDCARWLASGRLAAA